MQRVFVFDFDGTLVESNQIKDRVFNEILLNHSIPRVVLDNFLIENATADRYDILKFLSEKQEGHDKEFCYIKMLSSFNATVQDEIIGCDEVLGMTEMLSYLKSKSYPVYVNSRTPDLQLIEIIEKRNMKSYFRGIYGSRFTKLENLKRVCQVESSSNLQMLMLGDNRDDLDAAEIFGCPFIYRHSGICDLREEVLVNTKVTTWENFREVLNV